jgi:hypothetical protein
MPSFIRGKREPARAARISERRNAKRVGADYGLWHGDQVCTNRVLGRESHKSGVENPQNPNFKLHRNFKSQVSKLPFRSLKSTDQLKLRFPNEV